MNKVFAEKSLWKITYSTLLIFIYPCCCHPDPPAGGEGSVPLRTSITSVWQCF